MTDTSRLGGDIALGHRTIRRLGFGSMRLTGHGIIGPPSDPDNAVAVLRRAVDAGVNFIDTADSYGPGTAEEVIADALYPYDSDLVIATKAGFERPGPWQWTPNCRPDHLIAACNDSLARLRAERIDLFQLHTVDPEVPLADSIGALRTLQDSGKIDQIGICNVTIDQLDEAQRLCDVVSVQNHYSLAQRSSEDLLDHTAGTGTVFIPWYPLAAGSLTDNDGPLAALTATHRASAAQIALAWLLAHRAHIVPIPGTSRLEHLDENLSASDIELTDDDTRQIEQARRALESIEPR